MTCTQFLEYVSDYLDQDLDPALAAAVLEHSRVCPGCKVVLDTTRQTVQWIGDERLFALPEGADARLRKALEHGLEEPLLPSQLRPAAVGGLSAVSRRARFWPTRAVWALAAVLVIAVGAGVLRWRTMPVTASGWLMDKHCLTALAGHPQDHKRDCLIKCATTGIYGIVDAKGHFTPFDKKSNTKIMAALRTTSAPDHIWAVIHATHSGEDGGLQIEDVALSQSDGASR